MKIREKAKDVKTASHTHLLNNLLKQPRNEPVEWNSSKLKVLC